MVLLDTCITSSFDHFTPNLKTKDCLPFSQIVEGIEIAEHFKMRPSITPFMTPWLKGPCPLKLSKPLFNKITSGEDWEPLWDGFYAKFNFSKGVHMVPAVLGNNSK
ncbi:hypothetical protein Fcan01_10710 [Folsomia candida]|uniref:Uncharacterized protein n=1 Tax=Folsomia candida TaxID=158441 RepID=A0A226EAD9_FOLCA|nr:hypothetical protein Fcan01_10710 [Folsomia candida]